jgi:NADPH:quinone reductase-like Zn-dependent oxidoreductase
MSIQGNYTYTPQLPATPGFEGVGIVEQSGGGMLGKLMIGKRVAVLNRKHGNWCEQTVTSARQVIPIPKSLSDEQAATFFVNPATAWSLTQEVLQIPSGEWLVQSAANSSLGQMIVKLGQYSGYKTLNIVRRESEAEKLKRLGADEVICFDARNNPPENLLDRIRTEIPGGAKYIIDPVGGQLGSTLAESLGEEGQMVMYGTLSGENVSINPRTLMSPNATIRGFHLGGFMQPKSLFAKMALIRKVSRLVVRGVLATETAREYPLEQVREAVTAAQEPGHNQKILLRIGGNPSN